VIDPTGAGDSFAGGLAGYIASQRNQPVDHSLLATAMAFGTAVASFDVEEFGTERLQHLSLDEVRTRVSELHRIIQFTHPSVEETLA
jgi:sugar/nucleoside kinase (ribokinase family)